MPVKCVQSFEFYGVNDGRYTSAILYGPMFPHYYHVTGGLMVSARDDMAKDQRSNLDRS